MMPTGAQVTIVPAFELSETALKLSRVIEREAKRRSALRGSGVVRVEQNIPMFRRMSSRIQSSIRSGRSRRSVTPSIAPTPEEASMTKTGIVAEPLHPIRSSSPSIAAAPRLSFRNAESTAETTSDVESDAPQTLRGRIWEFFDDPNSSPAAYYVSVSLFCFIALSTMVFIAQTDKSLAHHRETLNTMESICAIVFTIEYLLRALVSPSKWLFFKNIGNCVDLAAILPYYLEEILAIENAGSFGAIRIVRLTRVARVLKMSRYSSAIQVFVQAIAISIKALSMLVFLMAIAVIVFSSAIYFAEYTPDGCRDGGWIGDCNASSDVRYVESIGAAAAVGAGTRCTCVDPNPYSSIAESFWWSIVTMSTVGYGDMTPVTTPGRIVGIATILTGMLVLALPITVIGTNFQKVMKSVMQQTMKSNVDYLKGKRQICREEIQAILQRFHAVTTDIHLDIDDIIQVYDTDSSGTLEDDELARFRRDLEMLQNRAMMNQNLDMQPPTTTVAIATPVAIPEGRASPTKAMGAFIRKMSSRGDIFTRQIPTPTKPEATTDPKVIPVPLNATVTPLRPALRSAHSHPNNIGMSAIPRQSYPLAIETNVSKTTSLPLAIDKDVITEASAFLTSRHGSGPTADQLKGENKKPILHRQPSCVPVEETDERSEMESPKHEHSSHRGHPLSHPHPTWLLHRRSQHDDVVLERLAEIERMLENRMVEAEARLESKILNLTKILMRVEQLIELND